MIDPLVPHNIGSFCVLRARFLLERSTGLPPRFSARLGTIIPANGCKRISRSHDEYRQYYRLRGRLHQSVRFAGSTLVGRRAIQKALHSRHFLPRVSCDHYMRNKS